MGLSVGIVGLPNVGKSTIFNALTAAEVDSANYPFCTIDPNVGVVPVPDKRLEVIESHIATQKVIPATVDIVDIAGLVKGASAGEGLGNKFLANIRETDAVLMVVRCFADENVVHVEGSVDPLRDIEIIALELVLADLESIQKRHKKVASQARTGDKKMKAELAAVEKVLAVLEEGRPVRTLELDPDEQALVKRMHLLSDKPVLYCCNVDEDSLPEGNEHSDKVRALAETEGSGVVIVCGKIEAELSVLEPDERDEMLGAYGLEEPALNQLIRECYDLLGLQSYFTAGEKEVRAWTVKRGATAPQAAGVIHSDFERGFIRAEVYALDDLREYGSEQAIKAAGKMRSEGKGYIVRDGDIMHFLFNV